MLKSKLRFSHAFPVILLAACFFCSCANTRQLTYLQGQFDTTALSQVPSSNPIIQTGDLLSIIVYSDNPAATTIYNQPLIYTQSSSSGGSSGSAGGGGGPTGSSTLGGSTPTTPGYIVDEQGNIEFQGLGRLHVAGLTRSELRDTLDQRFQDYLTNPYYTIRFLNYRFTILGEVNRQGIYSIPGDRINLLEALGLAGDMTFYGRRDNILVIREVNGKRHFARLDITKPEVMSSPYFYLQQNDVVYVDQNKKKAAASDQVTARNISIATGIITTLALLYSIFKK